MDFATLRIDRQEGAALYCQVRDALAAAIEAGELRPGDRLPSERDLARALGVSRTTAVNAYRELESRGLVRGHVGRGTFVAAAPGLEPAGAPFAWRGKLATGAQRTLDPTLGVIVRAASNPGVISFAAGTPALECFPLDDVRASIERALSRGPREAFGLAPVEGHRALRRAIAARMRVRPEQVLIVAGAQQGLELVARSLVDPGDAVIVDRPGYLGAIQVFRAAGARLIGWDAGTGDLEELEDLILRYRPKLLCTTTTFQNPTGLVWPLAQRREYLELAARYRVPVVEDEPYRDLSFGPEPPPSLLALDGGRSVIHIGTFSKTLAGGLRLGWVAADEAIVEQLALVKLRGDVSTASLMQLAVADFLTGGRYDGHVMALRIEHARRCQAMRQSLTRHLPANLYRARPVDGGLYLWLRLAEGLDATELETTAAETGVVVVAGMHFYPDRAGENDVRLCFSAVAPPAIDVGVRRLAAVITGRMARGAGRADTTPVR